MTAEIAQLVATIKRELKARGLTYRDVARALGLSEPSVKRTFAHESFSVSRLVKVSELLGMTLAELVQASVSSVPPLDRLTREQEGQLVSDEKLLLIAVLALNQWSLDDMVSFYAITQAEALKRLRILDRLGVIELLPGDRIRRRAKRDFEWSQDGPIRRYFADQGLTDFLQGPYDLEDETFEFAHGMLTPPAQAEFRLEMRRLRARLAYLHEQSIPAKITDKHGIGVLLALRRWEPVAFRRLRRPAPGAAAPPDHQPTASPSLRKSDPPR